jgi:hypothetical protein
MTAAALGIAMFMLASQPAWPERERQALQGVCSKAMAQVEATPGEEKQLCACVGHVFEVNVTYTDLEAGGRELAGPLLVKSVEACQYAVGAVNDSKGTPESRRAKIRELKKTGPLPRVHGWDLEAVDQYLNDCERAAKQSAPAATMTGRRAYCACTFGWLWVEYKQRSEAEAAVRRLAAGKSPPDEAWEFAAYWSACGYFAFRR